MKPQGKYNFLLIHDDGSTRSYRVSRTLIRFLLILAVVLPLFGGLGAWMGWKAWERGGVWDEEERALQNELISLRMQLNRLSHIEKLIQEHESGLRAEAAVEAVKPVRNQPAPEAAAEATPAGETPAAPVTDATSPEAPAAETSDSQTATEEAPEFPVVESDTVRLDNVSVLLVDGRRLRVRMDLLNESGRQIAGKVLLFVLTPDGQRVELAHNDPNFRISRLKKFAASSVVPETIENLINASLMVEVVDSNGQLLSRQFYPIAD